MIFGLLNRDIPRGASVIRTGVSGFPLEAINMIPVYLRLVEIQQQQHRIRFNRIIRIVPKDQSFMPCVYWKKPISLSMRGKEMPLFEIHPLNGSDFIAPYLFCMNRLGAHVEEKRSIKYIAQRLGLLLVKPITCIYYAKHMRYTECEHIHTWTFTRRLDFINALNRYATCFDSLAQIIFSISTYLWENQYLKSIYARMHFYHYSCAHIANNVEDFFLQSTPILYIELSQVHDC